MTGIFAGLLAVAGFAPVTNTYNSGSGTDTIPSGATQVVIEI